MKALFRIPFVTQTCLLFVVAAIPHNSDAAEFAIHIHVDEAGQVQVDSVVFPPPEIVTTRPGLLAWTDNGQDRWQVLPSVRVFQPGDQQSQLVTQLSSVSRGNNEAAPAAFVTELMTVALDQLIGGEVFRGVDPGALLTPVDDMMHVDGNIVIRRSPTEKADRFPETRLILRSHTEPPVSFGFTFPKDSAALRWTDIPDRPQALQNGLSAGEYTLEFADGGDSILFGIEAASRQHALLKHASELRRIAPEDMVTWRQLAVESLLDAQDDDGQAVPYIADAYNLLEEVPEGQLTRHLGIVRQQLLRQLESDRVEEDVDDQDATGISVIDLARKRISRGHWIDAQKLLQSDDAEATQRSRALARLYEAVILAESGQATGDEAYTLFMESLEQMQDSPPADIFRAHNNFAGFLLTRAQDQIHDHAFQMASGVANPLLNGLNDWHLARVHFSEADRLAAELGPGHAAAVRVSIARQYSVLADFIRLMNSVFPESDRFIAGETAATNESRRLADQVIAADSSGADDVTRTAAFELLARIAHRNREFTDCRRYAEQALGLHLERGSLAGAESAHRLLGLSLLREAEMLPNDDESSAMTAAALRHFQTAHVISEALRERFPLDETGMSRAGFFARRAYVNEQIIPLLIARRQFAEALGYAEAAKGRSFQDFLALRGHLPAGANGDQANEQRSLPELLANWPANTAALEYYLGSERAWVFVIDPSGDVTAHVLTDEAGEPISSRTLVARVGNFLGETRHQAGKMLRQHAAGVGFDKSWQDRLHEFYKILIPESARDTITTAKHVQIIPHHILHYFPFAALVTRRDDEERISIEMPQPRFLVEEDFDLCYAPSLAAWDTLRSASAEPIQNMNAIGISEFDNAPTLPGVRKDLENFRSAFHEHPLQTLIGREADEPAVTDFLNHTGLLFVATHGMNIADQPLSSFLLCHAGGGTDGRLTTAEILQHRINARLVVLSACYSGLADRSPLPGDDLFGLQRALLQSGATCVVSGLWDVYDETGAQLMDGFFQRLKTGDNVPSALAASQREFLSRRRKEGSFDPWIHPYFWAVYISTGSDLTHVKN